MKRMAAALVVVLLCSVSAGADTSGRGDPNDVAGPLDVKRIAHGHADQDTLWHKVVMYRRWGANDLRGDEIRFYFSNDREDRYDEVHVSVGLKDGKVAAWIFAYVEGSDHATVGPSKRIRLTRPDRYSVKIFFGKTWMANRRDRYVWSVGAYYKDAESRNCRRECDDYAPGHNPDRVEHKI